MRSFITRLFPTPDFLRFAIIGIDLSGPVLRFVELEQSAIGIVPKRSVEITMPEGVMSGGRVINQVGFTQFLKTIKKKYRIRFARVSISEPQTYAFMLELDSAAKDDIRSGIELVLEDNIPLKASETIFDYEVLAIRPEGILVQVVAMAANASNLLFQCFNDAGIIPTSFELEGQAIARAILPEMEDTAMIVDLGANRTGIAIVAKDTVVFSSTIEFGGAQLTEHLAKGLSISTEAAEELKRTYGFIAGERKDVFEIMIGNLSILKDEINRRFVYWHEKRQFPELLKNVSAIYITGGQSNLPGLVDYLSAALKISVIQGNPWLHCFSFEHYIPALSREEAISYTTAIGLALAENIHD